MKIHKHVWRVDGAYVYKDILGENTSLHLQCEKCGKVKRKKIADLIMSGDQVNNYCMARYNQETLFDGSAPALLKSRYR